MKKYIQLQYSNDLPGIPFQRDIEKLSLADRRSLEYRFGEPCNPRNLIKLYDVRKLLETREDYHNHYGRLLKESFAKCWSGTTLHIKDGEHLIMINPEHHISRRTFTIAHEFGHLALSHRPITITDDGLPLSRYSDEQELEAHSYGLAFLMPYAPLLQMLKQGASVQSLAYHYGISTAATEMRIKITGLWDLIKKKNS
jgi:Zn-dependent peptidase ImmA (M78 family)